MSWWVHAWCHGGCHGGCMHDVMVGVRTTCRAQRPYEKMSCRVLSACLCRACLQTRQQSTESKDATTRASGETSAHNTTAHHTTYQPSPYMCPCVQPLTCHMPGGNPGRRLYRTNSDGLPRPYPHPHPPLLAQGPLPSPAAASQVYCMPAACYHLSLPLPQQGEPQL